MNAVEIEEAVSALVNEPFDAAEFPFQFLAAFGAKDTTLKRLRKGEANASDVPGAVLQRGNIHVAVAAPGNVATTIAALRASPKTASAKAKFLLATDGVDIAAEDLITDEPPIACPYADLPRHFGFFLPLAGISTVKEIKNNPIDVKATGRLNRLYVELLKDNPDWGTPERRPALNQFMARLIFCFFAEDTGIFHGSYRFTPTVERMSDGQSGNTHDVIAELFRAMSTAPQDRAGHFHSWSDGFPFVNGGLFSGEDEAPRFSRTARAYLLRAGELDWRAINPDIFGSMIQAVADEGERGALGMHYTSVPNILKVLNPLFLDSLREQLEAAGTSPRKLRTLRRRLSAIRVFDPACGSGNFLVIAYKEMRKIEAEIVALLGGEANLKLDDRRSVIALSDFYGIEIKGFAAEIARLALLIAEFQADCLYLSQQEARAMVLPLHKTGQIVEGNALRLDWLAVCPPVAKTLVAEHDLAGPTGRLALEDNGLGHPGEPETYICGNPPYLGSTWQTEEHKEDLRCIFAHLVSSWRSLDYVSGWFMKAAEHNAASAGACAFVSTNSICQGQAVPLLWPLIQAAGREIFFAYTSFKWANLASYNAGVTVIIVGLSDAGTGPKRLYSANDNGEVGVREVSHINAYLAPSPEVFVQKALRPIGALPPMVRGNMPYDGGHLLLTLQERGNLGLSSMQLERFTRRNLGGAEFIQGIERYCLWIGDEHLADARKITALKTRIDAVRATRLASPDAGANEMANRAHQMREMNIGKHHAVVVGAISSENRDYLPVGVIDNRTAVTNKVYAIYDAPLWNMALIASRLHWVWIGTVCVRMRTDFSYSNTLGWNTFPVPPLGEDDKVALTRCAENILLAREAHFPATIADLYDPEAMPDDLRRAHDANDETLERIYIGRRFKNDTERLERLFDMYTKMTAVAAKAGAKAKARTVA